MSPADRSSIKLGKELESSRPVLAQAIALALRSRTRVLTILKNRMSCETDAAAST